MFTFLELGDVGNLGNQLFQVAAVIGAAHRHGTEFALPHWPVSQRMACFPFPALQRRDGWELYQEPFFQYREIPPPAAGGTSLWGYFQSWKYFSHCLDDVRARFRPSLQTKILATRKLPGLWEEQDTASIHIRRGEYQSTHKGCYVNLEETQYYRRAMREAGGPGTRWYVFSDDPDWCLRNFREFDLTVVPRGLSPYVDLVTMSWCRRNIIANSSFSWWAAMLNPHRDSRVYCPQPSCWFAGLLAKHDTSDLLPPDWIRIGID